MVQVSVQGDQIRVRSDYHQRGICKSITGYKWDPDSKVWVYPASAIVAKEIMSAFRGSSVHLDDDFRDLLLDDSDEVALSMAEADDLPRIPDTVLDPWGHQLQGYWFVSTLWGSPPDGDSEPTGGGAMLAFTMGAGKSRVAVDLVRNFGFRRVLICCPKSVIAVWPKQFQTHTEDPPRVLELRDGSTQKRAKHLAAANASGSPLVAVVNYESAWRGHLKDVIEDIKWDCMILDESHRIKSPTGKQSSWCAKMGREVPYRLCLTGTPMPHSPLDIFGQFRFLDEGVFGANFTAFRARYAIMRKGTRRDGRTFHTIDGYQNGEEMQDRFFTRALRVGEEVLDLPEAQHITLSVDLDTKARKAYKSLEENFYADVESGRVTAGNALVRLLRLQQLTGGYLPTDDGMAERLDTSKADVLADLFEDLAPEEPIVVFCRFIKDIDVVKGLAEKHGRAVSELSGRVNELREWQDGESTVIVVQIQSGGLGVDLTRACYCVYYSVGFSLGDYEQSLARVHRPGQERPVRYYHLIATKTVDERVQRALVAKSDVIESILSRE